MAKGSVTSQDGRAEVARRIRERMASAKLSNEEKMHTDRLKQSDLASRTELAVLRGEQKSAIAPEHISQILNGRRSLTEKTAKILAHSLETTAEYLLLRTDDPSPEEISPAFDWIFELLLHDIAAEGNALLPISQIAAEHLPPENTLPTKNLYFTLAGSDDVFQLSKTDARRIVLELCDITRSILHREASSHKLSKEESKLLKEYVRRYAPNEELASVRRVLIEKDDAKFLP